MRIRFLITGYCDLGRSICPGVADLADHGQEVNWRRIILSVILAA